MHKTINLITLIKVKHMKKSKRKTEAPFNQLPILCADNRLHTLHTHTQHIEREWNENIGIYRMSVVNNKRKSNKLEKFERKARNVNHITSSDSFLAYTQTQPQTHTHTQTLQHNRNVLDASPHECGYF